MMLRVGSCLLAMQMLAMQAAAQETGSPDKLRDALLAQERRLIEAINRKDKATIETLLADEAMSITSRGRQTTTAIAASLESISFSRYEISDAKVIVLGPNIAILSYKFSWTGGATGQPAATTDVYATSVWRQRDGKWRSVLYQETPIAGR